MVTKDACRGINTNTPSGSNKLTKTDISMGDFAEVYLKLRELFTGLPVSEMHGKGFVIAGGRAVNLYTHEHSRNSPDVDVVVAIGTSDLEAVKARVIEENEYRAIDGKEKIVVEDSFNPEKGGRSIRFRYPLGKEKIKFDVFHLGMRSLSGIPIEDILNTAQEVRLYIREREKEYGTPNVWVNVTAPWLMVIMKFNTWLDRGARNGNKDALDIVNMIGDQYRGSVARFIEQEGSMLVKYINSGQLAKPESEDGQQHVKNLKEFESELNKMCMALKEAQAREFHGMRIRT